MPGASRDAMAVGTAARGVVQCGLAPPALSPLARCSGGRMSDTIRVLHVTLTLSRLGGGVARYVWSVAEAGRRVGIEPVIAGVDDARLAADTQSDRARIRTVTGGHRAWRFLGYSPGLWKALDEVVPEVDVVHLHIMRNLLGWQARRLAARHGKPLIVSTHGSLHPWLMRQRVHRKIIASALWEYRTIRQAAALHGVSLDEARDARARAPRTPVAMVPIGVDPDRYLPSDPSARQAAEARLAARWPALAGKKTLLFLSLIMPRKGLVELVRAWGRVCRDYPDWVLVIGGIEIDAHIEEVRREAEQAGASEHTLFIGEVDEDVKHDLLGTAGTLVLPSYSEAFGIIVVEALASGCPVLTTRGTPWSALERTGCGWWIDVGEEALAAALPEVLSTGDEARAQMGERGRELVRAQYTWEAIAPRLRSVYIWALGREPRPPWVWAGGEPIAEPEADAVAEMMPASERTGTGATSPLP